MVIDAVPSALDPAPARGCSRRRSGARRRWPTPARTGSARSSTSSPRHPRITDRASKGWRDNNPPWKSPRGSCCCSAGSLRWCSAGAGGSLSIKKRVPQTSGTLRTDNVTFAGMLFGTVVLVGALSFMPAVVLGPVADHLAKPVATAEGAAPAPAPTPAPTPAAVDVITRSHGLPWECLHGRTASAFQAEPDRRRASRTAFPRRAWERCQDEPSVSIGTFR